MRFFLHLLLCFHQKKLPPVVIVPGLAGSIIKNKASNDVVWPPSIPKIMSNKHKKDLLTFYNNQTHCFYISNPEEEATGVIIPLYGMMMYRLGTDYTCPYDFRLLGSGIYVESLYHRLKLLVERSVETNQGQRCHIVGHSLGGLIVHDFLVHYCSQSWKDKYIASFISINTPFGGTVNALHLLYTKKVKYPFTTSTIDMSEFIHCIGGVLWSLPNRYYYPNTVFVDKHGENYTAADLKKILRYCSTDNVAALYQQHFDRRVMAVRVPNGVKTHLLYSTGLPTLLCINEGGGHIIGDGDDTVDTTSLLLPLKWWECTPKRFTGSHLSVLTNPDVINYIIEIVRLG